MVPSDWASRPALMRWKSGGATSRSRGALSRDRVADQLVGLVAERQPVLRLRGPRLALGVVERPLVERHDALPGRLDQLLAELDRLREDDLLLGRQQGDLADLLEVHPDRVVDPDHVGARSPRAPRRWARRPPRGRAWPARRPAACCRRPRRPRRPARCSRHRPAVGRCVGPARLGAEVEIVIGVVVVVDRRRARPWRLAGSASRAAPLRRRPWLDAGG